MTQIFVGLCNSSSCVLQGGKTARHKDKNLAKRLKKKAHKAVLKAADIAIAQHASGPSQVSPALLSWVTRDTSC